MFDNIAKFFKKFAKNKEADSKDTAKERLHLVLMQDRANVSADFLDLMKQEIIDVIKKYIDVDENSIDVKLTNKTNGDGTTGAPILYANIPIVSIKDENKNKVVIKDNKQEQQANKQQENSKKEKLEEDAKKVENNVKENKETVKEEIAEKEDKKEIKEVKEVKEVIKQDRIQEVKKAIENAQKISQEEIKKQNNAKKENDKKQNSDKQQITKKHQDKKYNKKQKTEVKA